MSRILVAYFSASGTTKQVGDRLALGIGADIFEIRPEKPYTESDLRWTNPLARCNREKIGRKDIPIARRIENIEKYETIFIGFPTQFAMMESNSLRARAVGLMEVKHLRPVW